MNEGPTDRATPDSTTDAASSSHPPEQARAAETDDPVETAWAGVLGAWSDREAHRKFIALCSALDRLADAGRHYRAIRDHDPDPTRRDEARQHIERLFGVAMQSLEAIRTPPRKRPPMWLYLLAGALVCTLLAGSLLWVLSAAQ